MKAVRLKKKLIILKGLEDTQKSDFGLTLKSALMKIFPDTSPVEYQENYQGFVFPLNQLYDSGLIKKVSSGHWKITEKGLEFLKEYEDVLND